MKTRLFAFVFALISCILALVGCASIFDTGGADILVVSDGLSPYAEVVRAAFPKASVLSTAPGNLPAALETDAFAVEAFDTQAFGYLQSNAAAAFYPHYLATVVIAIDRDRVFEPISGWNDLRGGSFRIAFPGYRSGQCAVLAMSVGLDGNPYDMTRALALLNSLHTLGRIETVSSDSWGFVTAKSFESAPVAILYDYEAASLRKAGRNIEIVVPREGTLCFRAGLLYDAASVPNGFAEWDALLLDAGFRLADGRCAPLLYPSDYSAARFADDAERFNLACQDVSSRLRREGWGSYRWSTADGDEHTVSFLVFFVAVILWGGAVYMRTLHRGIRRGMAAITVLLFLRVALRYVKTLFGEELFAARLIWYCYYIPLLLLPVFCLWTAWIIDKPEEETARPRWWTALLFAAAALVALTLTNDLHQFVFTFGPGFASWTRDYSLGFGYYLFLSFFVLCAACCVVMLVRKAGRAGPAGLLPLWTILILGGAFLLCDLAGVALVRQMQTPFITAVLLLVFFETALRSGFIPSNSKYGELFCAMPLDMKIIRNDGSVFCETNRRIPEPFSEHRTEISGGSTILRVDLSTLDRLKRNLEKKVSQLEQRGELLRREQRLKDELLTLQIQNRLYDEVEATIREKAHQVTDLIAAMPKDIGPHAAKQTLARAAVLTSYVKCRSNLLLTSKESSTIRLLSLSQFARDSAESARAAGIDCAVFTQDATVPFGHGVLAYDLFEQFLEYALSIAPCDMTVRYGVQNASLRLTVLISLPEGEPDIGRLMPEGTPAQAVASLGGSVLVTAEEQTLIANIALPLREGGGGCG